MILGIGKMSVDQLKCRWTALWLFSAAAISAFEFVAAANRINLREVPVRIDNPRTLIVPEQDRVVTDVGLVHENAILVLGNLGDSAAGDVEVSLSARRSSGMERLHPNCPENARFLNEAPQVQPATPVRLGSPDPVETYDRRSPPPLTPHFPDREPIDSRVYFLQSDIRTAGTCAVHSPLTCRLVAQNDRLRIYLDAAVPPGDRLADLIRSIDSVASSNVGEKVERLAGRVPDIDHDDHLAVVITSALAQLGAGQTPVEGLTRPADFREGLERPFGNNSDVIFLSSHLEPGDHLHAVLAHEWCHAAIFGRRDPDSQPPAFDEDWINEAIAHVIERRASGSATNLSHRIQSFLAKPEACPLIVTDYYQPEYWRHDGCRGAAFLFLDWCLRRHGEELLTRLVHGRSLNLQSLEDATGQPFAELFRAWTTELGRNLANQRSEQTCSTYVPEETPAAMEWKLGQGPSSGREETIRVCLRGTSARFLRIRCPAGTEWNLSLSARDAATIQTTLIPMRNSVNRADVD